MITKEELQESSELQGWHGEHKAYTPQHVLDELKDYAIENFALPLKDPNHRIIIKDQYTRDDALHEWQVLFGNDDAEYRTISEHILNFINADPALRLYECNEEGHQTSDSIYYVRLKDDDEE